MEIDSLTLEEKVGQLFMTGFNGTKVTGELIHLITYFKVGGLVYQKENVQHLKQLHKLSTNVQKFAKTALPLFLATEQEGGELNTIENELTISPSQTTLARANNRLYTRQLAEIVAKELRGIGVNMNFAPLLNVGSENERYFGNNIDLIAKHGVAAIQGYHNEGVCSVVKYVPDDPIVDLEFISLNSKKSVLYPFFRVIKYGAAGIFVPNSLFQASADLMYTNMLIHDTLRNRAKFDGLLITEIEPSTSDVIDIVVTAIENNVDMIVLRSDYKQQMHIISTIVESVEKGILSETRINESVTRILHWKNQLNVGEVPAFDRDLFRRKRSLNLVDRILERATVTS